MMRYEKGKERERLSFILCRVAVMTSKSQVRSMLRPLCVVAVLLSPLPATAADIWHGQIQCGPIPGVTSLPLRGDFDMVTDGSRLTYNRPVHVADQAALSGVREQGTGTLTGNSIRLQGGASGPGYSYTSAYSGQMESRRALLAGEQIWTTSKAGAPFHRDCHITLTR